MSDNSTIQKEFDDAARSFNLNKVKNMLEADVDETLDINYINPFGSITLLHIACRCSDRKLVKLLLNRQHKININAQDSGGNTSLHTIIMEYYTKYTNTYNILQILISGGADVNICDYRGNTPLHHACLRYCNKHPGIIKLLLDNGANINAQNGSGQTPLHIACVGMKLTLVKLLFSKSSEIDLVIEDNDGKTTLDIIQNSSMGTIKIDEVEKMFEEYAEKQYKLRCDNRSVVI